MIKNKNLAIQFFTDIHNYDLSFMPEKTHADILVCSGDLDTGFNTQKLVTSIQTEHDKPFYSALGNHDFWNGSSLEVGMSYQKWLDYYKSISNDNIRFLNNETIVVNEVALIFSTLWTDFDRNNIQLKMMASGISKDFQKIELEDDFIYSDFMYNLYLESRHFIIQELEKHSDKKCVVVTHNPPSIKCNIKYDITLSSYYWVGYMEDIIARYQPALWLSGHMHNFFDEVIHGTRVVINPANTVINNKSSDPDFKFNFVIEV